MPHETATRTTATRSILTEVGAVPFEWTLADDRLRWGANAPEVLGLDGFAAIATGRAWAALQDPATPVGREGALRRTVDTDTGAGVPYEIAYAIRPAGPDGPSLPLVETGRWYSDGRGRPVRLVGLVQRHAAGRDAGAAAATDGLTGEMSRAGLTHALAAAIGAAVEGGARVALALASIDGLDAINATYGKSIGDDLLIGAVARLKEHMRGGDVIGRIGGNRFAVVLSDCDEASASIAVRRFAQGVREQPVETGIGPVWITLTLGAVAIPAQARTLDEALERADEALRQARRLGPGAHAVYRAVRHSSTLRLDNRDAALELNRRLAAGAIGLGLHLLHGAGPRDEATRLVLPDAGDGNDLAARAARLGLSVQLDLRLLDLVAARLEAEPDLTLALDIATASVASGAWAFRARTHFLRRPDLAARLTVTLSARTLALMPDASPRLARQLADYGARLAIGDFAAPGTDILAALALKPARLDPAAPLVALALDAGADTMPVRAVTGLAAAVGATVLARGPLPAEALPALRAAGFDLAEIAPRDAARTHPTAA